MTHILQKAFFQTCFVRYEVNKNDLLNNYALSVFIELIKSKDSVRIKKDYTLKIH